MGRLKKYMLTLPKEALEKMQFEESGVKYGFADGRTKTSVCRVLLPIPTLKCTTYLEVLETGQNSVPILISLRQLRNLRAAVDLDAIVGAFVVRGVRLQIPLILTAEGHVGMQWSSEKVIVTTPALSEVRAEKFQALGEFLRMGATVKDKEEESFPEGAGRRP